MPRINDRQGKRKDMQFEHILAFLLLVMMLIAMCWAFWMQEINLISTIVGSVSTVFVMSVGFFFKQQKSEDTTIIKDEGRQIIGAPPKEMDRDVRDRNQ